MATGASHTSIIPCLLRTESVGQNPSNASVHRVLGGPLALGGAKRTLGKCGVTVSGGPRRHRDTGPRSGSPDCAMIHPSTCQWTATFARLADRATGYWLGAGRQRALRP